MEAFDLVMTVATLVQDASLLAHAAGWERANVTAARRGSKEQTASFLTSLDTETRRLLDVQAGMDDHLYAHAIELSARMHTELHTGVARRRQQREESCATSVSGAPGGKCNRGVGALAAACAVVQSQHAQEALVEWALALNASGIGRIYLHVDGADEDLRRIQKVWYALSFQCIPTCLTRKRRSWILLRAMALSCFYTLCTRHRDMGFASVSRVQQGASPGRVTRRSLAVASRRPY
jgi:hypothetical protein